MIGIEVIIGEKTYPCRITMGACRRFKQISGKEVTELSMDSLSEIAEFLYACTASACNADKVPFGLSVDDFCDALSAEDMESMANALSGEPTSAAGSKKKQARK